MYVTHATAALCSPGLARALATDATQFGVRAALVRGVPSSFATGSLKMEAPTEPINIDLARTQHNAYVALLRELVWSRYHEPCGWPSLPRAAQRHAWHPGNLSCLAAARCHCPASGGPGRGLPGGGSLHGHTGTGAP
jgi:hypothetical protein